jgi:glycosyltransferase involved in cell wall biosynthesis
VETIRGGADLVRTLVRHARGGAIVHLHTNGHNLKSWLLALVCGVFALAAPSSVVTFHSGLLPSYLARGRLRALVARLTCQLFSRVVCVNREIESALARLGVTHSRLLLLPAFLPPRVKSGLLPPAVERFLGRHSPVLSTALFFRPEYGFDLLCEAVARLRPDHPLLGLVVMGSGPRQEAEALVGRRGLHGAVLFAGDLEHDECVKVMARSDVFVRATRTDGDSISVREALSLGIPTVASQVGHRPEGVYLFPRGDVDGLVAALRAALGQRRRQWRSAATDTLRGLLAAYDTHDGPRFRKPEWISEAGRRLASSFGSGIYARTHTDR